MNKSPVITCFPVEGPYVPAAAIVEPVICSTRLLFDEGLLGI